jgi:uncharacterized protein (TIRG00374 family)
MSTRAPAEEAATETSTVRVDDVETNKAPALGKRFLNVRTLLSFAFGFVILGFLVTFVHIDVGLILDSIRHANPFLLALAFLSFYATFPVRALRWRRLLDNVESVTHEEGSRRLSVPALTEILFLGWFANCVVPAKLGDAYRAYLLKLNAAVSFATTIGTILAERIIDIVVLVLLMLAATSLSFGQAIPPQLQIPLKIGLGLVAVVVVGLVGMRRLRPFIERLLPERLHEHYRRFEHGTLNSFRGIPGLITLSLCAWAGEVARLYFVTLSLGVGGTAPSVIVFVALAAALMTTLPFTPGGLGVAEVAMVGIFGLARGAGLAPNVDEHAAFSIAVLDRVISYWSIIVVGLVVYPLSKRK